MTQMTTYTLTPSEWHLIASGSCLAATNDRTGEFIIRAASAKPPEDDLVGVVGTYSRWVNLSGMDEGTNVYARAKRADVEIVVMS